VIPPSDRLCAAVCRNGHVIKDDLEPPPPPPRPVSTPPSFVEGSASVGPSPPPPTLPRYCGRCGALVLQACTVCDALLLGAVRLPLGNWETLDRPDSFCWACGEAYPWATREEYVGKLFDMLDHDDLDEAELLTVREEIAVLSKPEDEVTEDQRVRAGETISRLAPKAWELFRPVAQSVLTAEVKRRLGLSSTGEGGPPGGP
jgi:hypothetical protein